MTDDRRYKIQPRRRDGSAELRFRFTPEECARIERAAESMQMKIMDYLYMVIREGVTADLEDRDVRRPDSS